MVTKLKLTMMVSAVALMCVSFAPQAQAYNEGDLGVATFTYIPELDDQTLSSVNGSYQNNDPVLTHVWPASVYNEAFGRIELPVGALQGTGGTREAASFSIPVVITDTGFPNMVTWYTKNHYQNGLVNDVSFFRVKTDGSVVVWAANNPYGNDPYGDPHGQAAGFEPITVAGCGATRGSASQIYVVNRLINVGGCLQMGTSYNLEPAVGGGGGGGEVDLSGLVAGQAAIEAKLDSLPAGPQGPQGDSGPTGAAGAAGDAGADGADGADAPCVDCADVQASVEAMVCKLADSLGITSIANLQASLDIVAVNSLLGSNLCSGSGADCLQAIQDGAQALLDSKQ